MLPPSERKPRPPSPRWFKIGVLLFIGLMILSQFALHKKEAPAPEHAVSNPLTTLVDTRPYADVLQKLGAAPKITEIKPGDGPLLLCGQEAELRVNAGAEEKILRFRAGDSEAPPLFERGITGMRIGGVRRMTLSKPASAASLGAGEAETPVTALTLELLGATPDEAALMAPKENALSLRLFDGHPGNGPAAICGDEVEMHLTLWRENGVRIFTTKNGEPVKVVIGKSSLPLGLEQALIGMQAGGLRTVILPPAWQSPLNSLERKPEVLHTVTLPQKNLIIADIERVNHADRSPEKLAPGTQNVPHR